MNTHDNKKILELQRMVVNLQQNQARIYKICGELYQELLETRKFVNFKSDAKPMLPPSELVNTDMDGLKKLSGDNLLKQPSVPPTSGTNVRKLKVINN